MSHTYHLICISCREVVDVGKIIDTDESGAPRPLGFGGWRDQTTGAWMSGGALYEVLERWLILHRGHELRVVSEPFLDRVDPDGRIRYVDSASEVLGRPVAPYPDDELDADAVPKEVAERLLDRDDEHD